MKNTIVWLGALLMAGCATERPMIPPPLDLPKKVLEYSTIQSGASREAAPSTQITETPKPPPATKSETIKRPPPKAPAAAEEANITLAFEQIPLPSFIQMVYGTILKRNVNLDPAIVARQDLVTIRTGAPQTATQAAAAARMLLKSYGIAVVDLDNSVRIVPDSAGLGYLPEIRRGRALPDTPLPLRPIFQLVELQAVRNTDIASWIRTMFDKKVNLQEDPSRNAVWLSGQSADVTAALEAIHVLDQPLMRGRHSARITPAFLSADELAKKLTEILQAEGYGAGPPGGPGGINMPVTLVPVPAVNAVVVFAGDPAIVEHVATWAKELDKPGPKGGSRSFFSYQVQNTDAQALAATLERIISGAAAPAQSQTPRPAGTPPPAAPARVVVDQASNTIIFQGASEDYGQIRSMLELLDRPAKTALIEVTVAEVTLTDRSQLGIEWLLDQARIGGLNRSVGTLGGLSIGTSGFNFRVFNDAGDTRLLLNALASNNQATILSSPRVMARNGETATIQVGQEVPIITSQQTTPTTGGTGSILQSIQYRTTGVILRVRPVIHSGNQINLEVSQEVSAAQTTTTGVNTSPTFQTRRLDTKLSLKDGASVLLGGLISGNTSQGDAGIPGLKDIPVLGQLFRNNTTSSDRTELIVLITPYIIANDDDAQAVTEAFKKQLGEWTRSAQPPAAAGSAVKPTPNQGGLGVQASPENKSGQQK
ncbi:MAG: hypothetical protein A3G25_20980 [Betaproteobacteria bacterium RIFCSPLOWO2_12_FULL_63_13]|nr:MAG: hypothetical protein A3G25_20980 [Betaproteobacteria bacterium RIFCSPLOWO2_12_FULL_63_13]